MKLLLDELLTNPCLAFISEPRSQCLITAALCSDDVLKLLAADSEMLKGEQVFVMRRDSFKRAYWAVRQIRFGLITIYAHTGIAWLKVLLAI